VRARARAVGSIKALFRAVMFFFFFSFHSVCL
jgi:hypothetical protein